MNFKAFYIKESLDVRSVKKSIAAPKHTNGDRRKSYDFTYDGREFSYCVSLFGVDTAKQLSKITGKPKEEFIDVNKDDAFEELTGNLFEKINGYHHAVPLDKIPSQVINDVKEIADLKQQLSPGAINTFGDLIDEL